MFTVKATTKIKRAPEKVFDLICDVRKERRWNQEVKSVEYVSGSSVGVGAQYVVSRKGTGTSRLEINQSERPSRFGYTGRFRGGEYFYLAVLTPTKQGSQLDEQIEMKLHGPMRVFSFLIRRKVEKDMSESATSLKNFMEGRQPR